MYAADFSAPNAQGRGAPARALSSFYRTVRVLVRQGLLRQLQHPRWSVQGWELVVENPPPPPPPVAVEPNFTPVMVRFFKFRFAQDRLARGFHTGRNGSCSVAMARALLRRGYAEVVRESTWETHWRVTDAGEAAWRQYIASQV